MRYEAPNFDPGHYPSPATLKRPIRNNATVVCLGLLLLYFLSMWALPLLWFLLLEAFPLWHFITPAVEQAVGIVIYALSFAVPTLLIGQLLRIPARVALPMRIPRAGIAVPAVFFCLGASVVGVFLYSFVSFLLELVLGITPIMPDFEMPHEPVAILLYAISITVMPAIFEEILFRGVILQSLRRYGDFFALWTSAILFGLSHGNLVQGPNAVLMGLAIGYFVLRTGSLFTGMLIHFINNVLVVGLDMAARALPDSQVALLNLASLGLYLLLGLTGLVWLLAGHSNMFRLMPSRYPLGQGKKFQAFFMSVMFLLFFIAICYITSGYFE